MTTKITDTPAAFHPAWRAFSYDWAVRLIGLANHATGPSGRALAKELATYACRDARGSQPACWTTLPRWWGPRARRVIGKWDFRTYHPAWVDHHGVVTEKIGGESVRCFIREPYPWFYRVGERCRCQELGRECFRCGEDRTANSASDTWSHVTGDFARYVPAHWLDDAQYLASATGCKLVVERVAWWNPCCIRLTFRPWDHTTPMGQWRRMFPAVRELVEC